ncbi:MULTISPECIES: malic enzyme-like NAD(P)-binding protein [unclassified Leptolyngbya]|uniref:malic enzyme-like NAD(P)-binding protein n=1 Tax=unclassified Leptolyngbya TaxID=2650499 RepID=UPI0016847D25|nr:MULTISPECIES: malic enzyme-like NAD(P)-binding protein [unclassified Leptolyngbya]MBD1910059.1 NAD-dependent malic enzyme [Leptolyngbya sp. FACHB-8]MBD2153077.1 NAD-dependent malic enzyme [Leptolyngbya sp. FACHB-16]
MVSLTPNPSYSVTVRVQLSNQVGTLGSLTQAIGMAGGNIGQIDLVEQNRKTLVRDIVVDAASTDQAEAIVAVIKDVPNVKVLSVSDRTFDLHRGGKIRVESKIPLRHQDDLAMAYTPGVGRICKAIAEDPTQVHRLTMKSNSVAIVTDGSAVLGLGNLGPEAALPVMEGKAMLFREFAGIDAFPLCLATQDPDAIVETVKNVAPIFGGVNLEDIGAPRCFDIERRLQQELNIPIFHDDQHGTAIVTLAALFNALRLVKKSMSDVKIVINGAGAAGVAIARLLRKAGANNILMCDSKGILSNARENLTAEKKEFAVDDNGNLAHAMEGADVFLGVSAPGVVTPEMVRSMEGNPIVFAMANPIPEIQPELVTDDVAVMATGRSDYPNQINNVLAFPGVFRGALDCRAATMTTSMYLEAANAIASLIKSTELDREHIIPSVFDTRVVTAVSSAVQFAARQDGVAES